MKNSYRFLSLILTLIFCIGVLASCSGGGEAADDTTAADTTAPSYEGNWPEVEGTVLYVDAAAEAGGDGSKAAPFASIAEAQTKIREIKSGDGLPEGGITVLVASGEYGIKDGLNFTEEDSGTETAPIKYLSAEKGGAVLNGGVTLSASDFEPLSDEEKAILNDEAAKNAVVKVDLTKYGITPGNLGQLHNYGFSASKPGNATGYSELFINNERMTLSRYPNVDAADPYLRTGSSSDGTTTFQLFSAFEFEEPAVAIKERGLNWNIDDVWVFGYFCYDWADAAVKVADVDTETLTVTLAQGPGYGISILKRLYFYNIFAETDVPGEYYIDREKAVLYVYPTEDFENSKITVSAAADNLITAQGTSYITIEGFEITGSRTGGLVLAGDHITVDDCLIHDIRYNAIEAYGTNITIQNSEICQIGDSGIIVTGGDAKTLTSSENLIYNNYIHHWGQVGRTYESAVELYGCGATLSHNEMHDSPHQAVCWDGPNHVMEYNEIYNVCLETSDCGAMYSGRRYDWYGGVVRYNYIHNVGSNGAAAQGIYLDDALSGQTVYGNIIADVTGFGIQVGGGRDNVIENNLIISSDSSAITYDTRARDAFNDGPNHWFHSCIKYMTDLLIPVQGLPAWLEAFPGH
ncbi:MAG: right-handed parallel beta-helix repeat-containing protein, partial [Clostridia bacterium]|nr:right-handed parallel beta-helix repeat-containing protein [Clostridia bacterium]